MSDYEEIRRVFDEIDARARSLQAKYDASQKAAGLAGNKSIERNRELRIVCKELERVQRRMHGDGHKSAAAMLNPVLRLFPESLRESVRKELANG